MSLQKMIFIFLCGFLFSCSSGENIFTDTNGKTVSLSQLRGKWVVVNYWATWCHNCIAEIQELNRFHEHHKNGAILIYGVNYDMLPPDEIKRVSDKAHIQFPVMTRDPKVAWHLSDISAIPMTFIINPHGKVVRTILGSSTESSLTQMIRSLSHAS